MKVRQLAKPVSFRERLERALIDPPDQPRRRVQADVARAALSDYSRVEILGAFETAAASTDDALALTNIAKDKELFSATGGQQLSSMSVEVAEQAFDRDDRLKLFGRVGLAAALGGSLLAASGLHPTAGVIGLAACGLGVVTAASTALMRQSHPHTESLGRLPIYSQLIEKSRADAVLETEVRELAGSLALSDPVGLEMTEDGLLVGDFFLDRG